MGNIADERVGHEARYRQLLREHAELTVKLRHFLAKTDRGCASFIAKFEDIIVQTDRMRHAVHTQLLACATTINKEAPEVLVDLLLYEGGAFGQEYGLPGAVILPLPVRTPMECNLDIKNPRFKHTGWRENKLVGDAGYEYESTNDHYLVEPEDFHFSLKSNLKLRNSTRGTFTHWDESAHVLLAYQAGVGCNAVFPMSTVMLGHSLRLTRCGAAAAVLGLRLCYADMSSSYHGVSWAFGLEIPASRFEEVIAKIRNNQAEWWINCEDVQQARKRYEGCWEKKVCPNCWRALKEPAVKNGRQWNCDYCRINFENGAVFMESVIGNYLVEEYQKVVV